ncbi:VOC family protein [Ancylobacter sp. SL191]|uniref:VOC family protein n=1 Tax=Ancylobacter sp. SL191 TaxID=2995166 RepID=UPI0022718516|nr:VOC family protein [Ancylobacter sp. SL191]WAC28974.1 VOC family protein [Ancylobacter sp. SL191]
MTPTPTTAAPQALPSELVLGAVRLRVRDAARSVAFYTRTVGLSVLGEANGLVQLGAGGQTLIELEVAPDAPVRPRGTTGLFHVAILVPDRPALAVVLRRLIAQQIPIGASDHLVSEALYLDDPDGNGIEIYRDRQPSEWRWQGKTIEMATQPLDMRAVLAELPGTATLETPMPAGTIIGHVHLQVGALEAAHRFYVDTLGFDLTTDRYPGALFVSAGGYHHHLGLNIWHSRGGSAAPAGSTGLVHYEIVLPNVDAVNAVADRLARAGVEVQRSAEAFSVADPWGTVARVKAA